MPDSNTRAAPDQPISFSGVQIRHHYHVVVAIGATTLIALVFVPLLPASLAAAYARSAPFFIVELSVFIFGVTVQLNLAVLARRETAMMRYGLQAVLSDVPVIRPQQAVSVLADLPRRVGWGSKTMIYYRTHRLLSFFIATGSPASTASLNDKLSRLTRDSADSQFEFPRYCIWVLPVVGFVGTLWGVTKAVAGFADMLASFAPGQESIALLGSLRAISIDLATAFETTLPALVASGVLALVLALSNRIMDRVLLNIDQHQYDRLISRLSRDPRPAADAFGRVASRLMSLAEADDLSAAARGELRDLVDRLERARGELEKEQPVWMATFVASIDALGADLLHSLTEMANEIRALNGLGTTVSQSATSVARDVRDIRHSSLEVRLKPFAERDEREKS